MNWELECNANLAKRKQAMEEARLARMESAVKTDLHPKSWTQQTNN